MSVIEFGEAVNLRKIAAHVVTSTLIAGGLSAATVSPAMAATSYPIYDANGTKVLTMSYDEASQTLTACYAPAGRRVQIQQLWENGGTNGDQGIRTVPEQGPSAGCTVARPYGGTGKVLKIRGIVDGFANEWINVA